MHSKVELQSMFTYHGKRSIARLNWRDDRIALELSYNNERIMAELHAWRKERKGGVA